MFMTSLYSHGEKDCNNYIIAACEQLSGAKTQFCYGIPTAQEPWGLAILGISLQMVCGLQGGHMNIVSPQLRQLHDEDKDTDSAICSLLRTTKPPYGSGSHN